jgi:hypothetical protein
MSHAMHFFFKKNCLLVKYYKVFFLVEPFGFGVRRLQKLVKILAFGIPDAVSTRHI